MGCSVNLFIQAKEIHQFSVVLVTLSPDLWLRGAAQGEDRSVNV